jgi:Methyltransferase domain
MGIGYGEHRRGDPRIAGRIERALGDARSVLNVGAGAGSYEPPDREVTAVEPSAEMIAQRPAGSAPVVQASVESLPFAADSFDATMGVLTLVPRDCQDRFFAALWARPELDVGLRLVVSKLDQAQTGRH